MKKFLLKLTLIATPLLLLLVAVNYFGDKGSLFQSNYEKEMVKIIAEGYHVTNAGNYSERVFQQELISSEHAHPDLVILGSSRTVIIHSAFFPGQNMQNNSVGGAVLQDIIGYYQLYKDLNKLPDKVLIGIDPWLFNENDPDQLWRYLSDYYHEFRGKEKNPFYQWAKYRQLLSLSYFQQSFSRFVKVIEGKKIPPKPTNDRFNSWPTRLTDGALVYHKGLLNTTPEEVEQKIKRFMEGGIYGLDFFHSLSEMKLNEFKQLIADMQVHQLDIEFILIPYPPVVFDHVQKNDPMVLETERFIHEFALLNHIRVFGTFNPFKLNMDNSHFIDGMHCNESGIRKVFEAVGLLSE